MQPFSRKFLAMTAVAALSAVTLVAQPSQRLARAKGHRMRELATALSLTPDQKAQAKSIFQEAGQTARPVRMQLRQDRAALQAAVKSGDAKQIEQLTASIGNERGQLAATRATAFSKLYKMLTPDQQQKFDAFQQSQGVRRAPPAKQN